MYILCTYYVYIMYLLFIYYLYIMCISYIYTRTLYVRYYIHSIVYFPIKREWSFMKSQGLIKGSLGKKLLCCIYSQSKQTSKVHNKPLSHSSISRNLLQLIFTTNQETRMSRSRDVKRKRPQKKEKAQKNERPRIQEKRTVSRKDEGKWKRDDKSRS